MDLINQIQVVQSALDLLAEANPDDIRNKLLQFEGDLRALQQRLLQVAKLGDVAQNLGEQQSGTYYGKTVMPADEAVRDPDDPTFSGIVTDAEGLKAKKAGVTTAQIALSGAISAGADLSDADLTSFKVFTEAETYNGESFAAGDELLGSNSVGKANIKVSPVAGTIEFRYGLITQAEINFVGADGQIGAGGISLNGLQALLKFYAEYMGEPRWAQIGMGIAQGFNWPVFSALFTGPPGDPLETNGDAETGDLTGWTDDESAWSAYADDFYAGARCFRHDPENDGCPGDLRQEITGLSANTLYALTFASKIASGILSPYCALVWKTAASAIISTDIMQGNGSSSWVVNTQVFRSPATADRVELVFYPGDPFNDARLDDIHLSLQAVSRQLGFFPDLTYLGGALVMEEIT